MPIMAIAALSVWDMACSLSWAPLSSFYRWWELEHGLTIPLVGLGQQLCPRSYPAHLTC